MKVSALTEKLLGDETINVEVMRNPVELSEWVVWVRNGSGKSNLLMNEHELVISTPDANQTLLLLRTIGVKQVNVVL